MANRTEQQPGTPSQGEAELPHAPSGMDSNIYITPYGKEVFAYVSGILDRSSIPAHLVPGLDGHTYLDLDEPTGAEQEAGKRDKEAIWALTKFVLDSEQMSDVDFRKGFHDLKASSVVKTSRVYQELEQAFSPTQRNWAIDHIFRVIYTVCTDHLPPDQRIKLRLTALLHDVAKVFLIERTPLREALPDRVQQGFDLTYWKEKFPQFYQVIQIICEKRGWHYRAKTGADVYQVHAWLSAVIARTVLKKFVVEGKITPEVVEDIVGTIRLHHWFEKLDKRENTGKGELSLGDVPDIFAGSHESMFTLLAQFALTDVASVGGYERFVYGNILQILRSAVALYATDKGQLREVISALKNQATAILEYSEQPVGNTDFGIRENPTDTLSRSMLATKIRSVLSGRHTVEELHNQHYDYVSLSDAIQRGLYVIGVVLMILDAVEEDATSQEIMGYIDAVSQSWVRKGTSTSNLPYFVSLIHR